MNFYLITFATSIFTILLSWTSLASQSIGIFNIFHFFYKATVETLTTQGLTIFTMAFFLHAILKSQAFQSLLASKKEWLQKKKYLTIALITFFSALLSTNLAWFDEFVFFYPLIIPLFLGIGLGFFCSFLCLYGGSIAGLMGLVSGWRMEQYFEQAFGKEKSNFNYSGTSGISFRLISFLIFTTIVIFFNIWYASRHKLKKSLVNNNPIENSSYPTFTKKRKIILAIVGTFLLISILAQVNSLVPKLSKFTNNIPSQVSSNGGWGVFGQWKGISINCLFLIGGMIISLISKQSIIKNLIDSIQESTPIILIYIFATVPTLIMDQSSISQNLARKLLPSITSANFKYLALFMVFGLSIILSFFFNSVTITAALVALIAPNLVKISPNLLIHAAIFSWIGGIIGTAFSPFSGSLTVSLEKSQTKYRQFIKETWLIWLTLFIISCGLIVYQVGKIN